MRHSKILDFLYWILPLHAWKRTLLRRHIERCSACRQRLTSREEARLLLIQADDVGDLDILWPAIKDRLDRGAGKERKAAAAKPVMATLRWAAAVAGLVLAVFLVFLAVRYFQPEPGRGGGEMNRSEVDQFEISYVKIENEPAQTFIFCPHNSHVVIIWARKKT